MGFKLGFQEEGNAVEWLLLPGKWVKGKEMGLGLGFNKMNSYGWLDGMVELNSKELGFLGFK